MTFLLKVMAAILEGGVGRGVIYNFKSGSTKDHFSSSFWAEDFKV